VLATPTLCTAHSRPIHHTHGHSGRCKCASCGMRKSVTLPPCAACRDVCRADLGTLPQDKQTRKLCAAQTNTTLRRCCDSWHCLHSAFAASGGLVAHAASGGYSGTCRLWPQEATASMQARARARGGVQWAVQSRAVPCGRTGRSVGASPRPAMHNAVIRLQQSTTPLLPMLSY
jgi:hypothetical protein